jgi:hypothetical protein
VPFALVEAAVEEYGPGEEALAWVLVASLAVGALGLAAAGRARRPASLGAAALVFDTAFLSAWAVLYAVEPGTPARELLVLAAVEAGLRYGRRAALWALATLPALVAFELRLSDTLDAPFDLGHAVFPAGVYLLVGLLVGALSERLPRGGSPGPPPARPPSA